MRLSFNTEKSTVGSGWNVQGPIADCQVLNAQKYMPFGTLETPPQYPYNQYDPEL
jgi:hypothetical protein